MEINMNENVKVVAPIYETSDYSIFKHLKGNRAVSERRIKSIIESINKVGYVTSPITVNENMEIIDGQGRVEALKRMKYPVQFCIHEGAGIEECREMNIHMGVWKVDDWIDSYAEMGDENYIRFKELLTEYKVDFTTTVIYACTKNTHGHGSMSDQIKKGILKVSEEEFHLSKRKLDTLRQYSPIFKRIGGKKEYYDLTILWCLRDEEIDNNRLFRVIEKYQTKMRPVVDLESAFKEVQDVYNRGIKNKVYIYTNRCKAIESGSIGSALKAKARQGMISNKLAQLILENEDAV